MPCPFPGMDPWLEHPALWPDVHANLITALAGNLNPRLRPRYRVAVEQEILVAAVDRRDAILRPAQTVLREPAVGYAPPAALEERTPGQPVQVELPYTEEVTHRWLEVRSVAQQYVVTVIEILSPVDKRPGEGRVAYERKRNRVLASPAHLVEIDLLRAGEPLMFRWPGSGHPGDYRILVSHAARRPTADLYPFTVRDAVPRFPLPLLDGDEMPEVDPGALLHEVYDRASYDLAVNYNLPPEPPLPGEDTRWAKLLVRQTRPDRT